MDIDLGKRFNSPLTLAEQNFITPSASMNGLLNFKSLIGTYNKTVHHHWDDNEFLGTFICPIESDSVLKLFLDIITPEK